MTSASDPRRLLGSFLRARREALAPQPGGASRRRTPGLRREEVAALSGLSTTWYTWLEQGRDITLSAPALARLATALQMSAAERAYLFELTRRRDPAPPAQPLADEPPAELAALLDATSAPAYLLDRLWRCQGWNEPARRLFSPWIDSREVCLLRYVFLHEGARDFIWDWENRARRLLAEFRADTAQAADDPAIQALVSSLSDGSPAFARFWRDHAVLSREGGTRVFTHPLDGKLAYTQVSLTPSAHPAHKLVTLLPSRP